MFDHAEVVESNGWRVYIYNSDGTRYDDRGTSCVNETGYVVKITDEYANVIKEEMP